MENAKLSRNQSYSARKRLRRRVVGKVHSHNQEAALPQPEFTADELASATGNLLSELQQLYTRYYTTTLDELSTKIGGEGCWEFLDNHYEEAKALNLHDVLRHLVFDAAGKFSDRRQLKLTRKHDPR